MRPLRPFCGTVLKAQLLTLPATISTSANGVVTTQLSFLPPASSTATEVCGSSDSRPATAQPPEPPPTTTKSYVSVTCISPGFSLSFRGDAQHRTRNLEPFCARSCPKLPFCGVYGKAGSIGWFCSVFSVTKTSKTRPLPFPKQARVDTYPSHPMALP